MSKSESCEIVLTENAGFVTVEGAHGRSMPPVEAHRADDGDALFTEEGKRRFDDFLVWYGVGCVGFIWLLDRLA